MTTETLHATRQIPAPPAQVFAVLADPASHAAIDGTGWVCDPVDAAALSEVGQRFRMAMHHDQHPDKDYEMTNEVIALDVPSVLSWRPGQPNADGEVEFGGWTWRYDLVALDEGETQATLTYDWSAATPAVREFITFPPFGPDHLNNSLDHLADLATARG